MEVVIPNEEERIPNEEERIPNEEERIPNEPKRNVAKYIYFSYSMNDYFKLKDYLNI
jgi:hypothetical protein